MSQTPVTLSPEQDAINAKYAYSVFLEDVVSSYEGMEMPADPAHVVIEASRRAAVNLNDVVKTAFSKDDLLYYELTVINENGKNTRDKFRKKLTPGALLLLLSVACYNDAKVIVTKHYFDKEVVSSATWPLTRKELEEMTNF